MKKVIFNSLLILTGGLSLLGCTQTDSTANASMSPVKQMQIGHHMGEYGHMNNEYAQHPGLRSGHGYRNGMHQGHMYPEHRYQGHMHQGHMYQNPNHMGAAANNQGHMPFMGQHHRGHMYYMGYDQLNLTSEQRQKIQALRQSQMANRQAEYAQQWSQEQNIYQQRQALINSSTINQTQLNNLADQYAAIAKQRFIEQTEDQHAVAKLLTNEQKQQIEQMRQQRQQN